MRKKPVDGFPTEFVALATYITAYSVDEIKAITEESVSVMVTSHDVLIGAHLRRTYSGHKIWQHQQATDAHRKAQKLWRTAGHADESDSDGALASAREATRAACGMTEKLSDTFPQKD